MLEASAGEESVVDVGGDRARCLKILLLWAKMAEGNDVTTTQPSRRSDARLDPAIIFSSSRALESGHCGCVSAVLIYFRFGIDSCARKRF